MKILNRASNNINIATFWENYNLKKYNFDPSYQREGDVWSEPDKSYLIDTILKNFPMPPIFLHQHIATDTGKTIYDVIDGKQRLTAIISFLNNQISVPEDFSSDGFGDTRLEGVYFKDFDNPELIEWKKNLWKYEITIEYVETDDTSVVNHIFDRLNRNGEPLTKQELRKAKYGSSSFYKIVAEYSESDIFKNTKERLRSNRLEHHEFVSELIFLISEDRIIAGDNPIELDTLYNTLSEKSDEELKPIKSTFTAVEEIFKSFNIDFDDKRLYGVSHTYGLWGLAWRLYKESKNIDNIGVFLQSFYTAYTIKEKNEIVEIYRQTMSAGTKSIARRTRRIDALYDYVTTQK
ncbi:MAG: DUF262 domain-containing protein [Aeromonas hydrophila]